MGGRFEKGMKLTNQMAPPATVGRGKESLFAA